MPELKPVGLYREMYRGGHADLPSIHAAPTSRLPVDRHEILEYMRTTPPVFDVMESVRDLITGADWIPGGPSLISDGEWIWRVDSIRYLTEHPLDLPAEFVEHVRSLRYIPPDFDRADESFQAAVLRYF